MAEFGEQLRKAREEKGITQQTLADQLYVTRQTVSRYETGERYPDIVKLKQLSSVLNVSVDYLLGDDEMAKVVEKSQIIENPVFYNITIALYTLIVTVYTVFLFHQTPWSSFIKDAMSNGGSYLWAVFVIQLLSVCLFTYGLVVALKGTMNPKRTGGIMMMFLILEGSKTFYYLVHGIFGSVDFIMILFSLLIISTYAFGTICAYLFFVKNKKTKLFLFGVIGIASYGIYAQIVNVYHILMTAGHLYSWMNSLLAFLMIIINTLFIYQAVILSYKRKQASCIEQK